MDNLIGGQNKGTNPLVRGAQVRNLVQAGCHLVPLVPVRFVPSTRINDWAIPTSQRQSSEVRSVSKRAVADGLLHTLHG